MNRKKSFMKGVLFGALAMFTLTMGIGVALLLFVSRGGEVVNFRTEQKLEAIQNMIQDQFLYSEEVDEDKLRDSIIKGYVEGLGDPYSAYYDEQETKELMESTTGEFEGIGVGIIQDPDTKLLSIATVYKDSPGEKAGLKVGDIFYKVDGEEIDGLDFEQIVSKIRGKKGTKVELTVLRGENMEEVTCVAIRDKIENITVFSELKENHIGYIAISGFDIVTTAQFEKGLKELEAQNMQSLIIDLRNNPGGNLSTVCEMLDLILPEGLIVYTEDKDGYREEMKSDAKKQVDIPMVVLVNGNSASASEIFAGAVQDYGVGKIVGTTTFGKGIVQKLFPMTDGTCLKLTISEYFTPKGRNIHGIGIEPDVVVEFQYDEANPTRDNQLEEAIKLLQKNK